MRLPIALSYALVVLFALITIISGNAEFVVYASVLIPLVILIHLTDKKFHYWSVALWGFVAWMAMHLAGGQLYIGATRLYDLMLIPLVGEPYLIFKYDQFVHIFCYIVFALLLAHPLSSIVKKNASKTLFFVVLVLASVGVGAANEIIEFIPVVLFNSPGPGGYINTSIDLIMNLLGSLIGAWIALTRRS